MSILTLYAPFDRELADIRGQGALNRDEFAVAMRLIVDKQAGKELPAALPASMIPPSLRGMCTLPLFSSSTSHVI
jgi:hypothetical protein